ncbi:MAG TPA: MBL fold metallo-hydrolase [Gemmatimonadaceae bacterium]|jgi:glyoxylase-like metal-dependent hydrolase (beta-lactamase superfamily II)|nr:MBL fold metallo-hydrolase [Gemmatimonadaceae bacterium]
MNIVNVGYDSTNYYVIGAGNNRLLVDVGWPGTLGKLLANLKRKGIATGEIKYLLATHYHPDHAGLVQEVKNSFKSVRLIVVEGQRDFIGGLKQWMKPEMHYVDIDLRDSTSVTLAESRAFLAKLGLAGEIIATPGHSDDSVTLILDSGDAFTGDLQGVSRADELEVEAVTASWEKIRAKGAKMIHPGHGPSRPVPAA